MLVHPQQQDVDPTDPFDAISGSTGLTGGVDGVLILKSRARKADAFLYVDGRDIEDQGEHPRSGTTTFAVGPYRTGSLLSTG
jgi:hypothetical protein